MAIPIKDTNANHCKPIPGGAGSAPVLLPTALVAGVRLNQLLPDGESKLHAIPALSTSHRRQRLAVRQNHLVAEQGVGSGDCQLGLAHPVLQDLALVPADLPWLLCLLVADGKGGEADGGQGKLGAVTGHVRARLDHRQHPGQLLLDVVLAESLADVDEVSPDVLGTDGAVVGLAEATLLVGDKTRVSLLQLLQHGFREVGVLPSSLAHHVRAATFKLDVGWLPVTREGPCLKKGAMYKVANAKKGGNDKWNASLLSAVFCTDW